MLMQLVSRQVRLASNLSRMCLVKRNCSSSESSSNYETLAVSCQSPFVFHVELNRPKQLNALNNKMWLEIKQIFEELSDNKDCRAIVLSGAGRAFTAGLDFLDVSSMASAMGGEEDIARRCQIMHKHIRLYQSSFTAIEKCRKPVICAMHGACIGGGVDMASAADIRLCSSDAWFQIKEVEMGLAADVGTLQRLPKAIGSRSLVNELALTARKFLAAEAKECGFVSGVFSDFESLMKAAFEMAQKIAAMSPVAVEMTKRSLLFSRDHSVDEGLEHIASWNQTLLQSEDFMKSAMAVATKSPPPTFSKL